MRHGLKTTILVAVALALAGCAAKSAEHPGTPINGSPRVLPDGRLATNPPPLTLQDVDRRPAASPGHAVMALLFWAQWGSPANIAAAYDPGVEHAIGLTNLLGSWESMRQSILTALPTIVLERVEDAGTQASIGLELASTAGPPTRQSFVLRRTAGKWHVVYDTLVERTLPGYVAETLTPNPGAKHVNPAALRAGLARAATYRAYWASQVASGSQPAAG